jgi:ribulose-phosphate 3-epimerase
MGIGKTHGTCASAPEAPAAPSTLDKIRALKQQITERGLHVAIEVNGGVNASNARAICDAGADVLVAGAGIFGQLDSAEAIHALRG